MRTILVVAYLLHYSKGSEFSVAWEYISHMSKSNKLIVLYGSSGGYHRIGNTGEMETYCKQHSLDNVTIIPVKPTFKVHNWDYSLKGIRKFYGEYRLWHQDLRNVVDDLLKKQKIDIVHFLGPIGYHEPGYLYNLHIPYIWGPIGGLVKTPNMLLLSSDVRTREFGGISLIIKSFTSFVRLWTNRRVKEAMRNADVVIGATTDYVDSIERAIGKKHHSKICYLPENCIGKVYDLNYHKFEGDIINLIFIGRLDEGKAPFLILEALPLLKEKTKKLHIDILGEGPLEKQTKAFVHNNKLDDVVKFWGKVDRSIVFQMLDNAHLMLLPSLYDANTTVVWEAMAHAVPTLSLDHCGMHDTIKERSGIKISIGPYRSVVKNIALRLEQLVDNPDNLKEMAINLLDDRECYTWDSRKTKFESFYDLAEKQFKIRQQLWQKDKK